MWVDKIPSLRKMNIAGPVFISIGDEEKLSTFLASNPTAPKDLFLVDNYEFGAYKAAGFGKIAENAELSIKGTKRMKPPNFGFQRWIAYLKSVASLSPIPKGETMYHIVAMPFIFIYFIYLTTRTYIEGLKFGEVPEGVLRLGGTIALNGDRIIYVYEDGVPGDYPDPSDVIKSFSSL